MSDTFELGGSGGKSFSFGKQGTQPGASITGTVLDMKEVQRNHFETGKPEFWDNGDPKMQYRVTLQTALRDPEITNDDGHRDLYLDGRKKPTDTGVKSRICAVLDAVRETTGATSLARGGQLTVTWVSGMGFTGDPRNYTATYVPPAMDLGNQAAPAPAAQPQPVAQAAPVQEPPVTAAPAPAPQPAQAPVSTEPNQGQIESVLAAGLDPRGIFPGVQLTEAQIARIPQPAQG